MAIVKYNLRILVKVPSKMSGLNEVTYMIEGSGGSKISGCRMSDKKTKLSSLINLIHADSLLY